MEERACRNCSMSVGAEMNEVESEMQTKENALRNACVDENGERNENDDDGW